jgi:hypothetical protein
LHDDFPQVPIFSDFVSLAGKEFSYRVRSFRTNDAGTIDVSKWSPVVVAGGNPLDPERLLTEIQEAHFRYFYDFAHPGSGLARLSTTRTPDTCATGATGMGLLNLAVAAERGFISRPDAAYRVLKELKFLSEKADRFHGAFPHLVDGTTGRTIPFGKDDDGADIVETAFLMQGVLFCREYFSHPDPVESEIRKLADSLWRGVEWNWFLGEDASSSGLLWHWSPVNGWKKHHLITGFNECQIVYILSLASPSHPIPVKSYWEGWESSRYGEQRTQFGISLELAHNITPPLFWTHYSYLGFDPRQLTFNDRSYFEHFRDFCLVQVRYAQSKSNVFQGYGPLWGITASRGPDGYRAFAPGPRDNGTLAPTAALASMPYVPDDSRACLLEMYQKHGAELWGPFGFYDAFNFSRNWVAHVYTGIDEGPIAPMIENYRSGLCWKTFMKAPEIGRVAKMLAQRPAPKATLSAEASKL